MKLSIIGANGKVGRNALVNIALNSGEQPLEVHLFGRSMKRIKGLEMELSSIPRRNNTLSFHAGETASDMENSDLVVMLAALWPTPSEKALYSERDPSGRLSQVLPNLAPTLAIAQNIKQYAPDAKSIIVTNQSDILSEIVRRELKSESVFGFGGYLDSLRLRGILQAQKGHMIGYHNSSMIPLRSSFEFEVLADKTRFEDAVSLTRKRGKLISNFNKNAQYPTINTGATIDAGFAIGETILALSGNRPPLEASFNVSLTPGVANHFGVGTETGLSIPILLSQNGVEISGTRYDIQPTEKKHLCQAQEELFATMTCLEV